MADHTSNAESVQAFDLAEILGDDPAPVQFPKSNQARALSIARQGIPVFPCAADKRPLLEGGFKAASTNLDQIRAWWQQSPNALIGFPTGDASGIAVLDLDVKNGKDGVTACAARGVDPNTASPHTVTTPSGGRHLYFKDTIDLRCTAGKDGIDVRATGGYVIAYGPLPDVASLSDWPAAFAPVPRPFKDPYSLDELLADTPAVNWGDVTNALTFIPADCSRDDWRNVGMALHAASSGGDDGFAIWNDWSHSCQDADRIASEREFATQWRSFKAGAGGIGIGTLFHLAASYGYEKPSLEISATDFDDLPDLPDDLPTVKKSKVGIIRAKNGDIKPTLHNAILVLQKVNKDQTFALRRNEMTQQDEWRGGALNDADLGLIRVSIEQAGMHNVGADLTAKAVEAVAQRNQYHPVRDWLETLSHDGKPRLDTWLSEYLRVEDSPYTRAVGRAFLIAMVARVMRPGCKHDHVLVLGGTQGIGKSTACRVLGGVYAGDNMPSIRDGAKEAGLYLKGHWIVELAELAPSRKAEAEDLKSFITRATDEIRAPYARRADIVDRQCVFVGTTNESEYLKDATGGRRWWPVTCGGKIDTDALAADRDQLFAEAFAAFDSGEAWHLAPELEQLAIAAQAQAREEHAWEEPIRRILEGLTEGDGFDAAPLPKDCVTVPELLTLMGVSIERQPGKASRDASVILKMFGWRKTHTKRGNVWLRPLEES